MRGAAAWRSRSRSSEQAKQIDNAVKGTPNLAGARSRGSWNDASGDSERCPDLGELLAGYRPPHERVHNRTMQGIHRAPALIAGSLVAVMLVCLVLATVRADERIPAGRFYDGLVAYNMGDFAKAAELWHPLAVAGDANAQCSLAILYLSGIGVRRDSDSARRLFLQAARQGIVQAQIYLSLIYLRGEGVQQDFRIAYMWSDIALAAGYGEAVELKDFIAENLTPDEVREAAKMAADWRSRRVDPD